MTKILKNTYQNERLHPYHQQHKGYKVYMMSTFLVTLHPEMSDIMSCKHIQLVYITALLCDVVIVG